MGDLSNFFKGKICDWLKGVDMPAAPADVYLALYTAAPNDAGGGTEVTGGSYTRQTVGFEDVSTGVIGNAAPIDFPAATADWGTITHFAIFDAIAGNMLAWDALVTPREILDGDTLTFDIHDLTFTAD